MKVSVVYFPNSDPMQPDYEPDYIGSRILGEKVVFANASESEARLVKFEPTSIFGIAAIVLEPHRAVSLDVHESGDFHLAVGRPGESPQCKRSGPYPHDHP